MRKKNLLGLNKLIEEIKGDLTSNLADEKNALFQVDEVIAELNFTISGDIESGFNLGVVSLGSNVDESRIQKITVKLSPLVKFIPKETYLTKHGTEAPMIKRVQTYQPAKYRSTSSEKLTGSQKQSAFRPPQNYLPTTLGTQKNQNKTTNEVARLKKLNAMLADNLITQKEYQDKKKEILSIPSPITG